MALDKRVRLGKASEEEFQEKITRRQRSKAARLDKVRAIGYSISMGDLDEAEEDKEDDEQD